MDDSFTSIKIESENPSHFFSKINSGFDDFYMGKDNLIEKIKKKENEINKLKDNIYIMVYGDLYKKKILEDKKENDNQYLKCI